MLTERPTSSVADIRRLAGRLSGRDVPKLSAYADDLEVVAEAAGRSTAAALQAIRVGIGLGGTMDVLDSPTRPPSRAGSAAFWPDRRRRDRASCCPRSTASRARSGGT